MGNRALHISEDETIITKHMAPDESIAGFVQSFWMLENTSDKDFEATTLPDGIVDFFLFKSGGSPMNIVLKGIDTEPSQVVITSKTKMFAIGFKLPAIENLFQKSVSNILNQGQELSDDFWQFSENDLNDFEHFCIKATQKIQSFSTGNMDTRKQMLFDLIYASNGSVTVKELSEKAFWSARQINRYFNQQFGIPLKAYCNILRFRASFGHIKHGKLFPEQDFFDQAHFIKSVKKLSGVLPKDLKENKNDRFLQFRTVSTK